MKYLPIIALALAACGQVTPDSILQESQALGGPRDPIPAPSVPFTAFAPPTHAVPVLLFHEICPTDPCAPADTYGMTQTEFRRTLMMLQSANYTPVSTAEYVRYLTQDWAGLPVQPILITFDDSRLDAYVGADDVLRVQGAKATMFVITNRVSNPNYLSWSELAAMQASGRWDMQLHANNTHDLVDGVHPLCNRLGTETFDDWKARAEGDIWDGIHLLMANIPGYVRKLYAVPFGDYGQKAGGDPAIAAELSWFFGQRFAAWFTQPATNADFSIVNGAKEKPRYTITNTSTAESVYAWLLAREKSRARTPSL